MYEPALFKGAVREKAIELIFSLENQQFAPM
jgi:hypothetical protein